MSEHELRAAGWQQQGPVRPEGNWENLYIPYLKRKKNHNEIDVLRGPEERGDQVTITMGKAAVTQLQRGHQRVLRDSLLL